MLWTIPLLGERQGAKTCIKLRNVGSQHLITPGGAIAESGETVDTLLTYIARLMALTFTSKPETLRSTSQVEIEYVLSLESRQSW